MHQDLHHGLLGSEVIRHLSVVDSPLDALTIRGQEEQTQSA